MKTAGTTEGPRNALTRRETGNTTEDETRPWQFIVCKLPATSPEQLTTHMMRNHWDNEWTLKIANTPLGIKITMRDANDQAQLENTGATTKKTKRTIEVETKDATEVTVKKVEEVDTTTKNSRVSQYPKQ